MIAPLHIPPNEPLYAPNLSPPADVLVPPTILNGVDTPLEDEPRTCNVDEGLSVPMPTLPPSFIANLTTSVPCVSIILKSPLECNPICIFFGELPSLSNVIPALDAFFKESKL